MPSGPTTQYETYARERLSASFPYTKFNSRYEKSAFAGFTDREARIDLGLRFKDSAE